MFHLLIPRATKGAQPLSAGHTQFSPVNLTAGGWRLILTDEGRLFYLFHPHIQPRLLNILAGGGARAFRDVSWFAGDVYRIVCSLYVCLQALCPL